MCRVTHDKTTCPRPRGFKLVFVKILRNFATSPIDEHMRITKLHYVFSFIFILFIGLSEPGFAQKKGKITKGLATWYGARYHGKKTTSGEVYNKNGMTAAHLTLPFGTQVKVTNPETKQSVIVRINDRGPFGNKKRIIDLSEAAARKIKIYQHGEAPVIVEILSATAWLDEGKSRMLAQAPVSAPENTIVPAYIVQAVAFPEIGQATEVNSLAQPLAIAPEETLENERKIEQVDAEQFANGADDEDLNDRLGRKNLNNFVRHIFGAS